MTQLHHIYHGFHLLLYLLFTHSTSTSSSTQPPIMTAQPELRIISPEKGDVLAYRGRKIPMIPITVQVQDILTTTPKICLYASEFLSGIKYDNDNPYREDQNYPPWIQEICFTADNVKDDGTVQLLMSFANTGNFAGRISITVKDKVNGSHHEISEFEVDDRCWKSLRQQKLSGLGQETLSSGQHSIVSRFTSYDWLAPPCASYLPIAPPLVPAPNGADYAHTFSGSRGLFGVSFSEHAFGWGDVQLLNWALQSNLKMRRFVEFGTYRGLTSLYLGITATMRSGKLTTFDIKDLRKRELLGMWNDEVMEFVEADVEDPNNLSEKAIESLKQADLFFCDGGDKLKEVQLYAQYLPAGASLIVHDVNYENVGGTILENGGDRTRTSDFNAVLVPLGFEEVWKDKARTFNSCARWWQRKSNNGGSQDKIY